MRSAHKETKTTNFFFNLNRFCYIFGLPSFWGDGLNFPENFITIYNPLAQFGNYCVFVLIISEYAAFFTQKNLTERQISDLILFCISHTIITSYRVRISYLTELIDEVTYTLGVALKEIYNDLEVERKMIRKAKFYSYALVLNCAGSVMMYTYDATVRTLKTDETFDTIIPVYPDILDTSIQAKLMRTVFNIFWWIFLTRIFSVYALVICLTSCLSHQFINLQSYFYRLNDVFDGSQRDMELKYEEGLKIGIKMHIDTLKCKKQIQTICRDVFSGQIIFNLLLLIIMMQQMVTTERTFTNMFTIIMMGLTVLLSTGFFMWNAGDITVEAELLPTAIYSSGWQNVYGIPTRVRNLVVISMFQAQQPVVLTGLGIIELSYQAYVSIVKSSYSVFSVVY